MQSFGKITITIPIIGGGNCGDVGGSSPSLFCGSLRILVVVVVVADAVVLWQLLYLSHLY